MTESDKAFWQEVNKQDTRDMLYDLEDEWLDSLPDEKPDFQPNRGQGFICPNCGVEWEDPMDLPTCPCLEY